MEQEGYPERTIPAGWWFHGQEEGDIRLDFPLFLSSMESEAKSYAGPGGRLFRIWVPELSVVDTLDLEAVKRLTDGLPIHDPYDDQVYETAEEFLDACSSDTWEAMEAVGLPSEALVYEGGVKNLYLRNPGEVLDAARIELVGGDQPEAALPTP